MFRCRSRRLLRGKLAMMPPMSPPTILAMADRSHFASREGSEGPQGRARCRLEWATAFPGDSRFQGAVFAGV